MSEVPYRQFAHAMRKIVPESPMSLAIAPYMSETAFETDIAAGQVGNVQPTSFRRGF